jgi:hypothetical protein
MRVQDTLTNLLNTVLQAIPGIVAFLLILLVGYILAVILRSLVTRLLQGVGLDRTLHNNQYGQYAERISPRASPSRLIGAVVFFFVLLGALSVAVAYTGNPGLTAFLEGIYSYLPKVAAAILIFVIAAAVATAVGGLVQRTMGDTPTGSIVQTVVPVIVMSIAVFMILEQLEIAPEIVRILFTALIGALALGLAIAFGLGGRNVAERILEDAYRKGQEKRDEARRDFEIGKERGRQDVDQARQRAQQEHAARGGDPAAVPGGPSSTGGRSTEPVPPTSRPAGAPDTPPQTTPAPDPGSPPRDPGRSY